MITVGLLGERRPAQHFPPASEGVSLAYSTASMNLSEQAVLRFTFTRNL